MNNTEPKTYDELLDDNNLENEERAALENEQLLGASAFIAQRRGRDDLLAEILLIQKIRCEWASQEWEDEDATVIIEVDSANVPRFTDQVLTDILSTFKTADRTPRRVFNQIIVAENVPPVPLNWREVVRRTASEAQVNNQGRTVRHQVTRFEQDGLQFTNALEVRFYELLKAKQTKLPADETISIFPLPSQRVVGRNFEPDFVVVFEGKAGIIELDGANHSRRIAADQSRDRLMRKAGFKILERLAVEEVSSSEEAAAFIDGFLTRLAKS